MLSRLTYPAMPVAAAGVMRQGWRRGGRGNGKVSGCAVFGRACGAADGDDCGDCAAADVDGRVLVQPAARPVAKRTSATQADCARMLS